MSHRIPAVTVQIGRVLDLHVQISSQSRLFIPDWKGWHMLTTEHAFDVAPGRAKLFLIPGRLEGQERIDPDAELAADVAYARWHQRDPEKIGDLEAPDSFAYSIGRVLRLAYRSDKWHRRGTVHDYDHDFLEGGLRPPILYTSHAAVERAKGACIVGGDMSITEGGIA